MAIGRLQCGADGGGDRFGVCVVVVAGTRPEEPPESVLAVAWHDMHMQMGQDMDHKGMDCCKECCKDMDTKHGSEHSEHGAHQQ